MTWMVGLGASLTAQLAGLAVAPVQVTAGTGARAGAEQPLALGSGQVRPGGFEGGVCGQAQSQPDRLVRDATVLAVFALDVGHEVVCSAPDGGVRGLDGLTRQRGRCGRGLTHWCSPLLPQRHGACA